MNTSSKHPQTWLILSHAFNMDGRAASQTITDKMPHLLENHITPIIISAVTGRKDSIVEHHQVFPAGPVALRFDLRHYLKQRVKSKLQYRLLMLFITILLAPFILLEKLFIPIETHWSWALTAYLKGCRIIRQQKPDIIYSTGGAYSAHIAGYWLAKKFGIKWIAEIHDPIIYREQALSKTRIRFATWLEKVICQHADLVWWFTDQALARAQQRHPALGNRGHSIVPGVNAPEFSCPAYQGNPHFTVGHFGSLSDTRNLAIFLQGLTQLLKEKPEYAANIRLEVYGSGLDHVSSQAIKQFPYPEIIQPFGRLEADPNTGESGRERVIKRMHTVDCLLLLHGTDPVCEEYIPSKTFEYLWTKRPILAMTWHNPQMDKMLTDLGHRTCGAKDDHAVAKHIDELYQQWQNKQLPVIQQPSPYTTEASVAKIIELVHQL